VLGKSIMSTRLLCFPFVVHVLYICFSGPCTTVGVIIGRDRSVTLHLAHVSHVADCGRGCVATMSDDPINEHDDFFKGRADRVYSSARLHVAFFIGIF